MAGTLRKISKVGEVAKKAKAPPIKASEALGKHEGKTLMITETDRTKVGEGFLGGPGFSSLQLEDPFYGDVGAVWGVGKPSKASTMIAANKRLPEGEVIWSTFLGKPDQHKSNQMVFDSLLKEFKTANKAGKLSDELKQKINDRLADAVDKDGRPIFPADVDITSPKFRNLANTFDRRAVAASIMGGEGVGGKKGQIIDYESIIQSTTDPDLIEAPTGAVGNRLFTLSNEVLQRPDLHPAFPSILTGEDLGVNFSPVIRELIMRDYIKSMMETKGRMPGQFDYTRGYAPMQLLDEAILTKMQKEGYADGGAVDAYQAQQASQSKRAQDVAAYKEGKIGADELLKYYPGLTAAMIEEQLAEMAEGGKVDSSDYEGPSLEDIINQGANDRAHQEWLENSSIQMLNFQLDDTLDKYRKGLVGEEALMRFFPGYTEYDISRMFGVTDQSPRNVKNMVPPVLTPKVFRESQSQAEEMERNAKRFPEMQRGFQLANGGPIEVKKKAGGPVFSQDQVFADLGDPSTVMTFGSLAMANGGEVKMQSGGGSRQAIQEQLSAGVPVFMSKGPEGQIARDIVAQEEKERERQEAERRARMQAKPFSEKFGGGYEAFQTLQSALGRSLAAPFVALSQGEEAARKFSEDIKIPESEYGLYALERTGEFLDPLAKALQESKITDAPYMPELGFTYIPGLGRQVADIARRTGKMAGEAIPPALKDLPVGMSIEAVGPEGKKLSVNDLIRMLEAGEEMTPEQRQKAEYSKAQKEKYAQANVAKAQKEPAPKEEAVKVPANEQGFFSSVEKAAANLKREEGSGDAFLSDIMKFNPSAGELEATGIADFLKGKKSVTRQEVNDFINQNKVEIEEVVRGTVLSDDERKRLNDLNRQISQGYGHLISPEDEAWFEATRERLTQFKEPKFEREGLILPNGKNYREILLKFKEKGERSFPTIEEWHNKNQKMPFSEVQKNPQLLESVIKQYEREKAAFAKNPNVYTSSHWPSDPNTFLHLRMQDMTIGGKKTLVIEEIQSDWHQQGKKQGYNPKNIENVELKATINTSANEPYYEVRTVDGQFVANIVDVPVESGNEGRAIAEAQRFLRNRGIPGAVPDAPFKKDWYQLGVKRLLRYAADNDYDQVALVGPDEQIRRGSLGTHIDGLIYEKNADGTIKLMAEKGESVVLDKTVEPKDLDLYVGKDVAKRILESKETDGTLTGDDLKIGGEGMRQYYGRNYPEYMNKLGRDYGTQAKKTQYTIKEFGPDNVEQVETGEVDRFGREVMAYQIRDPETDEIIAYETDFEKALKEANKKAPSTDMWVMGLPAKMKSDIKIGQPYKKGGLVVDEKLKKWHEQKMAGGGNPADYAEQMVFGTPPEDQKPAGQVFKDIGTDLVRGAKLLPFDVLGAPVDLATMAMRPFGYDVEKPAGGSEWLIDKAVKAGLMEEPTDSAAELASRIGLGVAGPGIAKGVTKAGKALKTPEKPITTEIGYETAQEGPFYRVKPQSVKGSGAKDRGVKEEVSADTSGRPIGGDVSQRVPDEDVSAVIKDPNNFVKQSANQYSQQHLGHDYTLPEMPPSSLAKQSAIGRTFQLAAEDDPSYKKAVFNAYGRQYPELVEQSGAQNYDQLLEAAYRQLAKETKQQFESLPVNMSFHRAGEGNYGDSKQMLQDIFKNRHLYVFQGGDPHTFLNVVDPKTGLNTNEMFRAVHDFYGHAVHGNPFGPKGEEIAYAAHAQMFSPLARMAMAAETRGQNSFVNYTPLNAELKAAINQLQSVRYEASRRGDKASADEAQKQITNLFNEFRFAPQKSVLLPPEFLDVQYRGGMPDYLQSMIKPQPGTTTSEFLTHFSQSPGLSMLDPARYGTGIKGEEAARLGYTLNPVKERTYFYTGEPSQIRPEPGLGPYRYGAMGEDLYDVAADPARLGLIAAEANRIPFTSLANKGLVDPAQVTTDLERLVKEYGYQGLVNPQQGVGLKFTPTPVKRFAKGGLSQIKK